MKSSLIIVFIFFVLSPLKVFAIDCSEIKDNFRSCEISEFECYNKQMKSSIKFQILGKEDGKCVFIKTREGGDSWKCKFSESMFIVFEKYFSDNVVGMDENNYFIMKEDNSSVYIVDGEEVKNPIRVFFEKGYCVVVETPMSGYKGEE